MSMMVETSIKENKVKCFVIVGFKQDEPNSVFYDKTQTIYELCEDLKRCIVSNNANIVSIRVIEKEVKKNG